MGRVIMSGIAPLLKAPTRPVYLYNLGDECTDLTGGWTSSGTGTYSVTKNSDNVYLYGQYVRGSHFGTVNFKTTNSIDLSKYSSLHIEYYDFSYSGTPSTSEGGCVFAGKSIAIKDVATSGVIVCDIVDKTSGTIDITLYPATESGTLTVSMYIKRIWLAKE